MHCTDHGLVLLATRPGASLGWAASCPTVVGSFGRDLAIGQHASSGPVARTLKEAVSGVLLRTFASPLA